ncbi:MAG: hypothetical protein INQ03_01705 [Candidatus Heimdallarchaeota archaeon]|nr:hypothetical protein [Candidatus Heimdallarchaeota archaeon]
MKPTGKVISVTILLILITSLGITIYLLDNIDDEPTVYTSEIDHSTHSLAGDLNVSVTMNSDTFYKGEKIPISIAITVEGSMVLLRNISFQISIDDRVAYQTLIINQTINSGDMLFEFELDPYFNQNGFIALNYGEYLLDKYSLYYVQSNEDMILSGNLNNHINIIHWPIVDQTKTVEWSIGSPENVELLDRSNKTFRISTTESHTIVSLGANLQTTGYTSIEFSINSTGNSTVQMGFETLEIITGNGALNIGNRFGHQQLSISAELYQGDILEISLQMLTQHNPIFVVNANNYWHGRAVDLLTFERPNYYLKQVSNRYLTTFNISFIEVAEVIFTTSKGTDLFELIDDANNAIGTQLKLNGSTWNIGTGPHPGNYGADIELVYTNKTMDHLGIVIGQYGEAFNIAVNARGSNFEGNFRITSNFADNLIQHEMSHIFGAPDRWTSDDAPSIMSKSKPEDAYFDIAFGEFWLMRTNWLEIDIQEMIVKSLYFL